MRFAKIRILLSAIFIALVAVFGVVWLLGSTATALAQGQELEGMQSLVQPPPPNDDDLLFIAFFTEELEIEITDLAGNIVGEGVHSGRLRCNRDNCSQKTAIKMTVVFTDPAVSMVEYKFSTRQALHPEEERAVVAGVGTLVNDAGKKAKFSFSATVQNNRDGTLYVAYVASRPEASLIVPRSAGTMEIRSR